MALKPTPNPRETLAARAQRKAGAVPARDARGVLMDDNRQQKTAVV
jgi:hypothetical protein